MEKLYVIAGPTACGKTAAAIELAKEMNGEVISADSMQVYIGMDIGTAKPTVAEMDGIPHYMIDVVLPGEPFSVAEYVRGAEAAIQDICVRGKTPILAGGTGFYINAVIFGTQFTEAEEGQHERDNSLRNFYLNFAKEKGAAFLHEKLREADPKSAEVIHPNNIKRVARALSFCESTGRLFSLHNQTQKQQAAKYDVDFRLISMPREVLYERINARVLQMWETGLAAEVRGLLDKGYHLGLTAMQGIGYKEVVPFINGEQSEAETIAQIQQATRNYAKRQDTWFRHQVRR